MKKKNNLDLKSFTLLPTKNIPFFDENPPGALFSYLTGDTEKVGLIRLVVPRIFVPLAGVISGVVVLVTTSWPLATVILLLLALEGRRNRKKKNHKKKKYFVDSK